jgi:hypothetical protein
MPPRLCFSQTVRRKKRSNKEKLCELPREWTHTTERRIDLLPLVASSRQIQHNKGNRATEGHPSRRLAIEVPRGLQSVGWIRRNAGLLFQSATAQKPVSQSPVSRRYAFLFLQCLLKPRVDKGDRQAVGYQKNAVPQRKQAVGHKKHWFSRKETDCYLPNARGNLQIMKPWQKQQLL